MSGVAVIRTLLAAAAAVTNLVPAARIKAGVLPLKTAMPAIGIMHVSAVRRNTTAMNETYTLVTERVQVTAMVQGSARAGGDYAALTELLAASRQACPHQTGTIAGVVVSAILPDIEGPDLDDPETDRLTRSQDMIVSWREAR